MGEMYLLQFFSTWLFNYPSSVQSLSRVRLFVTPWTRHVRPPCPSPTPRVYPNPCPLSHWCHPTISSSVVPFSSYPQSFPTSGSFQMSQLSCFFHDPADIGNLVSDSSAFSKTSLNIRKFTVHILLKPGLENFEHYFTIVSEKAMAPHSNTLAWKISWMESLVGCSPWSR